MSNDDNVKTHTQYRYVFMHPTTGKKDRTAWKYRADDAAVAAQGNLWSKVILVQLETRVERIQTTYTEPAPA